MAIVYLQRQELSLKLLELNRDPVFRSKVGFLLPPGADRWSEASWPPRSPPTEDADDEDLAAAASPAVGVPFEMLGRLWQPIPRPDDHADGGGGLDYEAALAKDGFNFRDNVLLPNPTLLDRSRRVPLGTPLDVPPVITIPRCSGGSGGSSGRSSGGGGRGGSYRAGNATGGGSGSGGGASSQAEAPAAALGRSLAKGFAPLLSRLAAPPVTPLAPVVNAGAAAVVTPVVQAAAAMPPGQLAEDVVKQIDSYKRLLDREAISQETHDSLRDKAVARLHLS